MAERLIYYAVRGYEYDIKPDGKWVNPRHTDSSIYSVTQSFAAAQRKIQEIADYWLAISGARLLPPEEVTLLAVGLRSRPETTFIAINPIHHEDNSFGRCFYIERFVEFCSPLELLAAQGDK